MTTAIAAIHLMIRLNSATACWCSDVMGIEPGNGRAVPVRPFVWPRIARRSGFCYAVANRRVSMAVLGIGGLFFRSRDPEMLTAWYRDHLNIGPGCTAVADGIKDQWSWIIEGGPVVFSPF